MTKTFDDFSAGDLLYCAYPNSWNENAWTLARFIGYTEWGHAKVAPVLDAPHVDGNWLIHKGEESNLNSVYGWKPYDGGADPIGDPEPQAGDVPDVTETNTAGGKQSRIDSRLTLVPAGALLRIGGILKAGAAKYGVGNWTKIDRQDHLDHALAHIYHHLNGGSGEDDLAHAACRLLFALSVEA